MSSESQIAILRAAGQESAAKILEAASAAAVEAQAPVPEPPAAPVVPPSLPSAEPPAELASAQPAPGVLPEGILPLAEVEAIDRGEGPSERGLPTGRRWN